ncbi:fluoride export protein 1 [Diutina catenulata]
MSHGPSSKLSSWSGGQGATALSVVFFSIWGVLARKGLTNLTTYPGAYLRGVVWANFAACLVMGMLQRCSHVWGVTGKPNAIFTGLTTGFCGTLSSFSSVMLDGATSAINTTHQRFPAPGYGTMEVFSVMLTEFGISQLGFIMGCHLGEVIEAQKSIVISERLYWWLSRGVLASAIALVVANAIVIGVVPSSREWTFGVLFAPVGALLRWKLSVFNGTWYTGTFIANITGSAFLATFYLLQFGFRHDRALVTGQVHRQLLQGLDDGFCGGLSTVSTFMVELNKPSRRLAYTYGVASILVGWLVVFLILGPYHWTHGIYDI